jgi:ubiquinone biosynthesis protein
MLNEKWIPSALVLPEDKKQIQIKNSPHLKFRVLHVSIKIFVLVIQINFLRLRGRLSNRELGILLRDFFEHLGILWIKIAQILSLRMDVLPKDICEELAHLQDQAASFPFEEAAQTIETQLKQPIDEVFSEFTKQPFAAASTAQVHRAYLRDEKRWVAVKVQRPHLQELFEADMKILKSIANFMETFNLLPWLCWAEMMWEINQIMCEELDYRYEAANMRRMKKILKNHKIYVPKLYREYSTPRLLVMEYIQGVLMSDYLKVLNNDPKKHALWLEENQITPEKVGEHLLKSYWRQIYEENLFHGDLHPGNIILLRNNRIVFIDFGTVGSTEVGMLRKYEALFEASVSQRYNYAIDLMLMMVRGMPSLNLADVHDELSRSVEAWEKRCYLKKLPYDERSFTQINDQWTRILFGYGVYMNWQFLRLTRSFTNMDGALRDLMPDANVHKQALSYLDEKYARKAKKIANKEFKLGSALNTGLDLINTVSEQSTFRIDIIRRMAQMFESSVDKFSRLISNFFTLTSLLSLLTTLYCVGAILYQHYNPYLSGFSEEQQSVFSWINPLDKVVWLVIIILLMHLNLIFLNLRKRFSTKTNPIPN